MQQFKAAVSRRSGRKCLWQSGYYGPIIRKDADLDETRQSIANNPLNWILNKD
ncbi:MULTISPECIES: hypothetical protein [Flavonifractor]|uniref:Transposase IS200-like domain-containing protein n=2 Tax=Flavonifractor plautii TaxID=292800 RepID=G9YU30_FLAPL|nr:hypothetical protein [Flavonifractor plautii]EHM43071.1 hypothetical protein HMPREF0372_03042 [Flavonifractor plautii ATCC 29863]MBM6791393.1 hypothetical protein [Flavonifractor plautii]QIA29338.1 hypothetical protein GXM20_01610 [Flavonifractor plautii]QQR07409.1 hypothetical protein I5Q84_08025 [Flavonifractor plautii]UQA28261.1 hypothetical protein M2853_08435 [Flavonifractor plautii]